MSIRSCILLGAMAGLFAGASYALSQTPLLKSFTGPLAWDTAIACSGISIVLILAAISPSVRAGLLIVANCPDRSWGATALLAGAADCLCAGVAADIAH